MSQYLIPIEYAIFTFPVIAFLITFPYMFYQYFKYGSVVFLKALIIYTFVLYCINICFLVALPLPTIAEVKKMRGPYLQLEPLRFLKVFRAETVFRLHDRATWLPAMKQECFYVPAFNVLMLAPMGVYLRYYYKRNVPETVLICFLVSAFFEFSQYTALFGMYPRPYRMCDVDDLIQNTTGGLLGYLFAPLITWPLPSKDELNHIAYEQAFRITFFKRLCALIVDLAAVAVLSFLVEFAFLRPVYHTALSGSYGLRVVIWILLIYFVLVPTLLKGRTVGKLLFKMKLVQKDGSVPKFYQYLIRYALLFLQLIGIPYLLYSAYEARKQCSASQLPYLYMACAVLAGIVVILALETFVKLIGINSEYLYGKLSGTHNESTFRRS